jgi:prevent-host-death family protein
MYRHNVQNGANSMSEVNITELRKHLPTYLKQVSQGHEVLITSHGKIIARLIPEKNESEKAKQRLRSLRNECSIGDITSPIDDTWDAEDDRL